jgi:hypothetical protein
VEAILVGYFVGTVGRGDINLDDYQVGLISNLEGLNMLIQNGNFIIQVKVSRQCGQSQRREKTVLNRSPKWAVCLCESRQD